MKKSFLKRAATLLGAVILALPLATSALSANGVKAADDSTAKQTIKITKFGFYGDAKPNTTPDNNRPLDQEMSGIDNQATVNGAQFEIYNVTEQYWEKAKKDGVLTSEDANNFQYNLGPENLVTTITTKDGGKASVDLDVKVGGKPAIYAFQEVKESTPGYDTQQSNFIVSLPYGKVQADGKYKPLYIYPKNIATKSLDLKFIKKDSVTERVLAGAEFVISNSDKKYAKIVSKDRVTGFSEKPVDVIWVAKEDATKFVSDEKGLFGFTANAESIINNTIHGLKKNENYHFKETKAPEGYNGDAEGNINETNGENDLALPVKNTPTSLLPHTGGAGIIAFVVAGVILIGGAVAVGLKRRRSL